LINKEDEELMEDIRFGGAHLSKPQKAYSVYNFGIVYAALFGV